MSHTPPAPGASDKFLDHPFDLSIIPEDMEVNDALAQNQALEAVLLARKSDLDEDRCFFEQQPERKPLAYFQRIYEARNVAGAIKLLSKRCQVEYDLPAYRTPSDSKELSWKVERHFVDMMVCVGKEVGLGVVLPNQNVNSFYSVEMNFGKQGKRFRATNVKLGFNPSGRMLWIGYMPCGDNIWIAWKPKHCEEGEEEEKWTPSCLANKHYRITVMLFAFLLKKIGYLDIVVHNSYPDLSSDEDFLAATNLQ